MSYRVYGPYSERGGRTWRVIVSKGVGRKADKEPHLFATEAEAQTAADRYRKANGETSVQDVIDQWLDYLAEEGRAPGTLETNRYRLEGLLGPVLLIGVPALTQARCEKLYEIYREGRKPDTHQGALAVAKGCFEWARKRAKLIRDNPWDDVDPRGRKSHGKVQLKKDDTRKLYNWLVRHVPSDDDRPTGVFMALVLGLRAHEVVGRTSEHIDNGGTELRVTRSKTRAGIRAVRLPKVLQYALMKRAVLRSGPLLPYHRRWVLDATKWACEQAGVPVVCAQALRGMYATALLDNGVDPDLVAQSIGHRSKSTTFGSYAEPGSGKSSEVERVIEHLESPEPTPTKLLGEFLN